jgi:hypothetical protein
VSDTTNPTTRPPPRALSPSDILINLIVTLLAPMFLTSAGGNINYARRAAAETIKAHGVRTLADLITMAQIVAFGLAALASLSQSMEDNMPLPLALRLRGNANASNRSAEQNRRALKETDVGPGPAPQPKSESASMSAPAAKSVEAARPTRTLTEQQETGFQAAWAASAATIAAETAADLPNLPPEERRSAELWINVLNSYAADVKAGKGAPRPKPGDLGAIMHRAKVSPLQPKAPQPPPG